MTATTEELWAESVRLEEPLREEDGSLRLIDSPAALDWFRDDWAPRHDVAAMTLADFAEWDAQALRATAREHYDPEGDDDRPLGAELLISAALIAEKPPAERANLLANGVAS